MADAGHAEPSASERADTVPSWAPLAATVATVLGLLAAALRVYWSGGDLPGTDTVAHYATVAHLREALFPAASGWNAGHFLGYPQGTFYHPLFHYVVCLIAWIGGEGGAMRIVVVGSVLCVPVAAHFLGRRAGLRGSERVLWLAYVIAVLRFTPEAWGGNLLGTTQAGDVTATFAIPFLLMYLASLYDLFDRRRVAAAAVWLALTFLAHVYAGIAVVVCSVGFALCCATSKREWRAYATHLALSLLLAAFWLVPLLAYRNQMYGEAPAAVGSTTPFIGVLLVIAALTLLRGKTPGRRFIDPLVPALLLLLVWMHLRILPDLPFHMHRFRIYALYTLFLPLAAFVVGRRGIVLHWPATAAVFVASLAFAMLPVSDSPDRPQSTIAEYATGRRALELATLDAVGFPKIDGRVLVVGNAHGEMADAPRALDHWIVLSTPSEVGSGLFVESAPNARFVASLQMLLDPVTTLAYRPHDVSGNPNNVADYLQALGITHVLAPEHVPLPAAIAESDTRADVVWTPPEALGALSDFRLYELAPRPPFATVLTEKPSVVTGDWDAAVNRWWIRGAPDPVLVRAPADVPDYVATGDERVELVSRSDDGSRIRLRVESGDVVPVLIRSSYFPKWKAYVGGKPAPVYQASPHLLLVYGNGEIELVYERAGLEAVAYATSGVAWLLLIGVMAYPAARRLNGRALGPRGAQPRNDDHGGRGT